MNLVIAAVHDWDINSYENWQPPAGYRKYLISTRRELTLEKMKKMDPKYIFFPHWSWKIPQDITVRYECVVFHMTDLPFGRGGTPLQNLITKGIYRTKISAIRATNQLDGGSIYLKKDFSLKTGSAREIYMRAADIIYEMIEEIIEKKPNLTPQQGKVSVFKRRTPQESEIPLNLASRQIYDFIRMLDAPGYPKAFLKYGSYRLEFTDAKFVNNELVARVRIKKEKFR